MLTNAQIDEYHTNGFVIPDFRMPGPVLEAIKARHQKLLADHPEHRSFATTARRCSTMTSDFWSSARNDEILDMVGQLIGPDFALWNSSFFAKPALDGKAHPLTRT
ncbi:MAG: hypothetical protein R3E83_16900 [Burkholderiaceae bacterium]